MRPSGGRAKVNAALLVAGLLVTLTLAIGLFNVVTARWLLPDYRAHDFGREMLLQIPFTLSRTYTVTLECGETRRRVTVKEWSHRAAGDFALEHEPACSRALSIDRWRKRGRA